MLLVYSLITALVSSNSHAFSPPSTSRRWKKVNYRSSKLFDSEQSPWSPPPAGSDFWNQKETIVQTSMFAPTEEDLKAVSEMKRPLLTEQLEDAESEQAPSAPGVEVEFPPKRRIQASVRETGYDSMKNYIKSMCDHELLNRNEEIILAREIQILLKWEEERELLESKLLR